VREKFPSLPDPYDIYDMDRSIMTVDQSHVVTHGSWPKYQNTIDIGGVQCKPGKELPPDLKKFMESHPEGVVLVSFGSTLSASQMSPEQQLMFQEAFRDLALPVIWKWDGEDLSGMPDNVFISNWLPQNDLLAHPNLKVFVTHGGLLSTQEALYHNVPLVGTPLGMDQMANMRRAEKNGFGIVLDFKTLTKERLVSSIKKAFTDKNMHESMAKMHKLFTDYSLQGGQSPMERAVSAFNFVLENKGIEYFKPPRELLDTPLYAVYGYDVVLFLLFIVVTFFVLSWQCLKFSFKLCCGSKKTKLE